VFGPSAFPVCWHPPPSDVWGSHHPDLTWPRSAGAARCHNHDLEARAHTDTHAAPVAAPAALRLLLTAQTARAARQELQRLESSVAKSERLAANVLQDLRSMRSNSRATELRSEVGGGAGMHLFAGAVSICCCGRSQYAAVLPQSCAARWVGVMIRHASLPWVSVVSSMLPCCSTHLHECLAVAQQLYATFGACHS
jgi:hypothetical protein